MVKDCLDNHGTVHSRLPRERQMTPARGVAESPVGRKGMLQTRACWFCSSWPMCIPAQSKVKAILHAWTNYNPNS